MKNLAEVSVNGKPLGIVWKAPFRVDVTRRHEARRRTPSRVKVTNLWVNRLIGDQQPDATKKYTYTAQQFYRADLAAAALRPSGAGANHKFGEVERASGLPCRHLCRHSSPLPLSAVGAGHARPAR